MCHRVESIVENLPITIKTLVEKCLGNKRSVICSTLRIRVAFIPYLFAFYDASTTFTL